MTDKEIRSHLFTGLLANYLSDPDSVVVNEMCLLGGKSIIDIAVINNHLFGIEIKSGRDTLGRLPGQIETYSKIFDEIAIITEKNHLAKVMDIVPSWWCVICISQNEIIEVRKGKQNPSINSFALARLLWREECKQVLDENNLLKGNKTKPCRKLWPLLSENIAIDVLAKSVRKCLKSRTWRTAVQAPLQYGG